MKISILFLLRSGIAAVLLLPGYSQAQPEAVQNQPAPAVRMAAAQAEPTNSTATPVASAGALTQFLPARSGSTMRLVGGATLIGTWWQVQSMIIQGKLEVGPNFPVAPGQAVTPGPVVAATDVYIPVTSLKSVEEDGSHYSDAMDDILHEKLKPEAQKKIHFHLTELVLKEAAKAKDQPYRFDAKGDLAVAGVTNRLAMPVQVLPLGDKKLKISGETKVKMTDFKIMPPTALNGALKTYDEVKLSFDWMVSQKPAPAAK